MDVYALSLKLQAKGQREVEGALKSVGKSMNVTAGIAKAAGAAIGTAIVGTLALVIKNSMTAESAMAQLNATLKSTGNAAGLSAPQIAAMASDLQKVTAFGDEAIVAMQSVLLTFTKVRGNEFRQATASILDMATALKMDLKGAALQVGKALNDPIAGVSALGRAGVQFTAAQKETIAALVQTGRTAEAQRIILKELETQFGGSARAARETLAGALQALANAFGDLFERQGVMDRARVLVEKITQNLQTLARTAAVTAAVVSAQFFIPMVAGLANLTRGLTLATAAAKVFNATIAVMGGPAAAAAKLGILVVGAAYVKAGADADKAREQFDKANESLVTMSQGQLEVRLKGLLSQIEDLKKEMKPYEGSVWLPLSVPARLKKQIEDLQASAFETARALRSIRSPQKDVAPDERSELPSPTVRDLGVTFTPPEMGDMWADFRKMMEDRAKAGERAGRKLELMVPVEPRVDVSQFASAIEASERDLIDAFAGHRFGEAIGNTLVDSLANGIEQAVASERLGEGFKALGATLLAGLGDAMMSFGKASAVFATFMDDIMKAFSNLLPGGALAKSLALIGIGAALKGAARGMFGGGGGGGGFGGGGLALAGGGRMNDTFTRVTYGPTNANVAAGMEPRGATNITVIGPNDPQAQRQIQELISRGARR